MRNYNFTEAEIIVKEMMDQLCLDMTDKKYVTENVSLYVGYSLSEGTFGTSGSVRFATPTNIATTIISIEYRAKIGESLKKIDESRD